MSKFQKGLSSGRGWGCLHKYIFHESTYDCQVDHIINRDKDRTRPVYLSLSDVLTRIYNICPFFLLSSWRHPREQHLPKVTFAVLLGLVALVFVYVGVAVSLVWLVGEDLLYLVNMSVCLCLFVAGPTGQYLQCHHVRVDETWELRPWIPPQTEQICG